MFYFRALQPRNKAEGMKTQTDASVLSIPLALLLTTLLSGCVVAPAGPYYDSYGRSYDSEVIITAPPAPRLEYPGPPPTVGYLWMDGYWAWGGRRYDWRPGHWEAPRRGYTWVPRRWEHDGDRWHQYGGRWEREDDRRDWRRRDDRDWQDRDDH